MPSRRSRRANPAGLEAKLKKFGLRYLGGNLWCDAETFGCPYASLLFCPYASTVTWWMPLTPYVRPVPPGPRPGPIKVPRAGGALDFNQMYGALLAQVNAAASAAGAAGKKSAKKTAKKTPKKKKARRR